MASAVDYHCPSWCNRKSKHAADRLDSTFEGIDWHTSREVKRCDEWWSLSMVTDQETGRMGDGGVHIFDGGGTEFSPAQLRRYAAFLVDLADRADHG